MTGSGGVSESERVRQRITDQTFIAELPRQVEGAVSVLGLVLGGAVVGLLEGAGRAPRMFDAAGPTVMISGLLVGLGTKVCCWF